MIYMSPIFEAYSEVLNDSGDRCEWLYSCCRYNDNNECLELCQKPLIVCTDVHRLPKTLNILTNFKCPEGHLKDDKNTCRKIVF